MLPQSKAALAFLLALPFLLIIPLWQTAQKRPHLWGVMSAPVTALALSHNGSVVAFAKSDGTFGVWSRVGNPRSLQPEGRAMSNPNSSTYAPARFRFSADDQTLLASNIRVTDSSTALYTWDVETGRINWSAVSAFKDDFCRYWPSADGKRAAQRSYDVVKVLDITGKGVEQNSKNSNFARSFPVLMRFQAGIKGQQGGKTLPQAFALSPDNKTLVLVTTDGALQFRDASTGTLQSQTKPALVPTAANWELQYSPDGRFVALLDGTTLSVWDVTAGKWSTTGVASPSSEVALAWMPDSNSVWTGSGTVQQWSVPALKSLRELPVSGPLAVSGDGRTLVTRALSSNGVPGGIWVWNIG